MIWTFLAGVCPRDNLVRSLLGYSVIPSALDNLNETALREASSSGGLGVVLSD